MKYKYYTTTMWKYWNEQQQYHKMFINCVMDESWAQGLKLRQSQLDIHNTWWWYSITDYILPEFPASFLKKTVKQISGQINWITD